MNLKIKSLSLILLTLGLVVSASAKSKAVPPVNIVGLPLTFEHAIQPGQGMTKLINLSQIGNFPSAWKVTCNYQAVETGNGKFPISILVQEEFWANYSPEVYVDGKDIGHAGVNIPTQTTLSQSSGTITFTNVSVYQFDTPQLMLTNIDPTGNFTITSCQALYTL